MNITFIAQWLFVGNSENLHYSDVLHAVRNFVNQALFSSKHVSTFYRENMMLFLNNVTATLRAFFGWHA